MIGRFTILGLVLAAQIYVGPILMSIPVGARAAGTAVGLGLAVSSLGVTLGPPTFGWCVERVGSYRGPWIGLAVLMGLALALLSPVRERPRMA